MRGRKYSRIRKCREGERRRDFLQTASALQVSMEEGSGVEEIVCIVV